MMKHLKQVMTVAGWEFSRFFKPKNEALGLAILIALFSIGYFTGKYALSRNDIQTVINVMEDMDESLKTFLSEQFVISPIPREDRTTFIEQLKDKKEAILLEADSNKFFLHAYKNTRAIKEIKDRLHVYHRQREMRKIGIRSEDLQAVLSPAPIMESFVYADHSKYRLVLSYFFAGLMILAVFLSFAYQFTAITGEKQLKITEQIISAIRPQVWMDGKIFGITLTGLASMLTYAILSVVGGMLFFQFTGLPPSIIRDYLHLPSIFIFLLFSLIGILIWNTILAGIASIITDPNNSSKTSFMLLPVVFVVLSFLVTRNPDSGFSVFLSWFPLTSATAMPVRWAITEVEYWQLIGSLVLLALTFYFLRKLAAKIFRVSVLITGKEPTWNEVYRLSKEN